VGVATRWAQRLRAERGCGPVVEVALERCLRERFPRSACARCAAACPVSALELVPDGVVVNDRCSGCEACVTACPTRAIAPPPAVTAFRDQALAAAKTTVRVSCVRQPGRTVADVAVGCLAGLPLATLLAPFGHGTQRVEVERGGCIACDFAGVGCRFEIILAQARALLDAYGFSPEAILEVGGFPPEVAEQAAVVGRRDLFRRFTAGARETVAALRPPEEIDAGEAERGAVLGESASPLVAALRGLGKVMPEIPLPEGSFTATLTARDTCFACNVCEAVCPTVALRREVVDGAVHLRFTAARCVGCGACAEACLAGALQVLPQVTVGELLAVGEVTLVAVAPRPCRLCGTPFTGIAGEVCEGCLTHGRGVSRLRGGTSAPGGGSLDTGRATRQTSL